MQNKAGNKTERDAGKVLRGKVGTDIIFHRSIGSSVSKVAGGGLTVDLAGNDARDYLQKIPVSR